MKLLLCLLLMLVTTKECNQNQENNDAHLSKTTANVETQIGVSKISYRASTRGFFEVIEIKGDSVSFTKDYNLKKIKTSVLTPQEQSTMQDLMAQLNLKALKDLKAPSTSHQYDGAPAAFLKIEKDQVSYTTSTFDHGNPPNAIRNIVDTLIALKTKFEEP